MTKTLTNLIITCLILALVGNFGQPDRSYASRQIPSPPSGSAYLDDYDGVPDKPPDRHRKKGSKKRSWVAPAIIGGVAALAALGYMLSRESKAPADSEELESVDEPVERLLEQGPLLPHQFNMSAFGIRCLIKGGWPIVVDYEQTSAGYVNLQISARGTEILTYPLHQFIGLGRHQLQFTLPQEFGDSLKPALIAVMATKDPSGQVPLSDFRIFALGIGPRAVGSVAIDEIDFNPDAIRPQYQETARYKFHSKSDFDKASVEIMNVDQGDDGNHIRYVDRELIPEGVRQGQWVGLQEPRDWDGKDRQEKISIGAHQLQVRTWDLGGDWVGAWSDTLVDVQ